MTDTQIRFCLDILHSSESLWCIYTFQYCIFRERQPNIIKLELQNHYQGSYIVDTLVNTKEGTCSNSPRCKLISRYECYVLLLVIGKENEYIC